MVNHSLTLFRTIRSSNLEHPVYGRKFELETEELSTLYYTYIIPSLIDYKL